MAIKVKYISDADGNEIEVVVPIALWRAMASSPELSSLLAQEGSADTCLMNGEKVEGHLLDPGERTPGLTLEEAGIEICEETGLPMFRMPVGAPQISTEFIRSLEDEW